MTPQEAIKILRYTPVILDPCVRTTPLEYNKMLNIAEEAIKKQIPKKVIPFKRTAHDFQSDICKHSGYPCEHIKTFNNEYQYTDYKCPLCHKRVSDGTPKHCDKCGQALDWSDTNG